MESYRDYTARWGVLLTVVLLNISNNALWISFSSVTDVAAQYYGKEVDDIDWLGTIGFLMGMPVCLASTMIVDRFGLRSAIFIGTMLTFMGGFIRALTSFTNFEKETQYWLVFAGQALTGMGNPMAVSVPTKVSQHWFRETQRTFATILSAMSMPLGIVLGQGMTPLFVKEVEDVVTLNWVYFIPISLTVLTCIFGVRSSKPPTPPSRSAEVEHESLSYLKRMKKLLTNKNYLVINVALGGAVGFYNCLATQLQQFMCSRGYANDFAGLCGSLLLGMGFVGSIVTGVIVHRWKSDGRMEEVAKVCYALAGLAGIMLCEFLRKSNQDVAIALNCALFGLFGFGMYPLGLELSVENTYPIDEAAGTALIFFSGQIQGSMLILVAGGLEQELPDASVSVSDT